MKPATTDRLVQIATIASSASALAVAVVAIVVLIQRDSGVDRERTARMIPDWERLADGGQSVGPSLAPVTIIEFGDYQCPSCRDWHHHAKHILATFPDQVRFVYRHWPLPYHQYAYPAARAAECAGLQGRFWEFHTQLMEDADWLGDAFDHMAASSELEDVDRFRECRQEPQPVPAIENAIADAEAIGATGTPTVIVNGLMLGARRDSVFLRELIEAAIR